ncbi:MAG: tetratricopeptide repeat protein [Nitrospinota bacterium]
MKKNKNRLLRGAPLSGYLLLTLFILASGCTIDQKLPEKRHWVEKWADTHALNTPRAGAASGVYGRYIYAAGGGEEDTDEGIHNSVEFTRAKPDGTLEPWRYTRKLSTPRIFAAGIVHKGFFYVVGGEKGIEDKDLLKSVERGRILPDGRIEEWVLEDSVMATPRRAPVVFVLSDRLYASGGYNGKFLTDVESAPIGPDGALGPWRNESSDTTFPRYIHSGVVYDDNIVLFGGHSPKTGGALDAVEWTSLGKDDGYLRQWTEGGSMQTKRYLNGSVLHSGNVYLVGGRNSVLLREVSKVRLAGKRGEGFQNLVWERDSSLDYPREAPSVALVGDFIYCFGGKTAGAVLSSTIFSQVREGHKLGHWSEKAESSGPKRDGLSADAYSHFLVGNEFMEYGKLDFAYEEIRAGLDLYGDAPEGHYLLGQYYVKKGFYDKGTQAFVKANELKKEYAEPHIGLGIVHMESGRLDEALQESLEAVRINPKMPEAYYLSGLIYLRIRDFSSAKKNFKSAIEQRKNFADAYHNLGIAYFETKEFTEAIGAYKRALQISPGLTSARINLAASFLRVNQFRNAISEYDFLLSQDPQNTQLERLRMNARVQMATAAKMK